MVDATGSTPALQKLCRVPATPVSDAAARKSHGRSSNVRREDLVGESFLVGARKQ